MFLETLSQPLLLIHLTFLRLAVSYNMTRETAAM